jgi:hypothetical protein
MRPLTLFLFTVGLYAQPYSSRVQLVTDVQGEPSVTRSPDAPTAGEAQWQIHFVGVPSGDHVRILRTYGDFVVWPNGVAPAGTISGTFFMLNTSAQGPVITLSASTCDTCLLHIQQPTGGKPERAAFDVDVKQSGLLEDDNILYAKTAVWLNNMGLAIHMEATWVAVYQIEDANGSVLPVRPTAIKIELIPHRPPVH